MAEILCKKCGQIMELKSGITKKKESKNYGKPWKGWRCTNQECGAMEFVNSDTKPTGIFEGTKKEEPKIPPKPQTETISTEKKIETEQEMWQGKEIRGHLRALTATILASCFAPRTNEDSVEPVDRLTCALDLAEIALERIYNVSKKI